MRSFKRKKERKENDNKRAQISATWRMEGLWAAYSTIKSVKIQKLLFNL